MASQSLAELARTAEQKAGKRTPAQESHFLCTWMADSLKEKRFSRLVMEDLKDWVQLGRTLGAGADLKGLLERIMSQYERAMAEPTARQPAGRPVGRARGRGLVSDYRQRGERQAASAIGRSAEPHHQRQRVSGHIEAGELIRRSPSMCAATRPGWHGRPLPTACC